jgi:hypothetical protein
MNPGDYVATVCETVGIGAAALLVLGALGLHPLQVWLDQRRVDRSRSRSLRNADKTTKPAKPF